MIVKNGIKFKYNIVFFKNKVINLKKSLVLGISASYRNRANTTDLLDIINGAETYLEMKERVDKLAKSKKISNTECILTSALFGASKHGADVEIMRLNDVFPSYEPFDSGEVKKEFYAAFERVDGLCIATPVYFGDRSSYVNNFFNLIRKKYGEYALDGKVVGVVSAGAKRNGGQETTNIYALYDCSQMGAITVSNGSPTSQYGGTAWAGDAGVASEDEFGMATSFGTGRNIVNVSALLHNSRGEKIKLRVGVLVSSDTQNGVVKDYLSSKLDAVTDENFSYELIDLPLFKINRCEGCTTCPYFAGESHEPKQYGCIQDDDVTKIHEKMINADAFILTGYQTELPREIIDVYQVFAERTRFMRRDNYQLAYTPLMTLGLEDQWAKSIFHLRVMTSFIRHNMAIIGPSTISRRTNGRILEDENVHEKISRFLGYSSRIVSSKRKFNIVGEDYVALGYGDFEGKVSDDLLKTRISKGKWLK